MKFAYVLRGEVRDRRFGDKVGREQWSLDLEVSCLVKP